MKYNFDKVMKANKFEVCVDTARQYGYFEHDEWGDECGGGLWFENNALVDYDGVACLPKEVAAGLRGMGFVVSADFD